jgi:hypothetical protein
MIVREYAWNDIRTQTRWIESAVDGLANPNRYRRLLDLAAIRVNVLGALTADGWAERETQSPPRQWANAIRARL